MEKFLKTAYSFLIIFLFVACSSKSDIVIDDFESGTFDNWTVEGDAFGSVPAQGAYPGQQEVKGFEGKYLANSFNGGDDSRGTLISKEFTIERDYINFLLGGGMSPDTYIELIVDGKSEYITQSIIETETLLWMTWDVKKFLGKKAVIRIVDNQRGGWGHILVDQIEMSNQEKSDIKPNHKLSFNIKNKYLLIPVEDKGPDSRIYLEKDGEVVSPLMNIRVAQTKIDYWVPIDVEKFKGQDINLVFDHVKKSDIGHVQIKPSDSFYFDYNEKYRPDYHFSPQYGWTNDPNGMVYQDGEYHLYYQHNPYGSTWGNMNWGHTVTKDFTKWEHFPDAIAPDSLGTIFSGSAVIDVNNTAGFGKGALIAIYTSAGQTQTQSIAYSLDNGRTFTKYANNPVLIDPKYADFRDPKVFWHEASKQWIMSLATTQVITFYGSKNFKEWTKLSDFGEGIGGHGGVWECPDLFPVTYNGKTKWVLFVSINPGGPNGGNATQYFIGDFDGKTFKADDLPYPLWLDYGRDNYAGVTWSNEPNKRHLFIGWMSNWDYANHVPTLNFRNAMTIPREISIVDNGKHLVVASSPVKEMEGLRSDTKTLPNIQVDKSYVIEKILDNNTGAFEIEFDVQATNVDVFEFKLKNISNEEMKFIFDLKNEELIVDRSKSGVTDFSNNFANPQIKSPLVKKSTYHIRLFIDKASSEIFVNGGELVQTNIMFPSDPYNSIEFKVTNGSVVLENINIYRLK